MHALLLALTLASAPATKVKLAVPDIQAVGIEPKLAAFFGEHLATQLKLEGLQVVTSREISSLLGLERQAALLGCTDQAASCMAELANALGADAVVLADLARLGEKTQVNVKAISASDGRTLGVFVDRVQGDEAIADSLGRAAQQLSREIRSILRPGEAPPAAVAVAEKPASGALARLWWAPTALGGALVVTGAVLFGLGKADYSRLANERLTLEEALALRNAGPGKQTAGVALLGAGAAAVAVGIAMKVIGSSSDTQVAVVPSSHGAAVMIGGSLP